MSNDVVQKAAKVCRALIGQKNTVTEDQLDKAISDVYNFHGFETVKRDELKKILQAWYSTVVDDFEILEGKERRTPWLKEYKSCNKNDWPFWSRYKEYLNDEKNFTPSEVNELDKLTDTILDKLFDPTRENIQVDKEGLVVGQVQSGKTGNYTGVICKAADAGFNLIIVLAGIHNNLRSQTQLRLDYGFLGFNTQYVRSYNDGNKLGVGFYSYKEKPVAHSITTSLEHGDFTKKAGDSLGINFETKEPILLVVKKNNSVLRRLMSWLQHNSCHGVILNKALLMIDDEADNASINTNKPDQDPTAINKNIRQILKLFKRRAYIGYTATPFANIFIAQNIRHKSDKNGLDLFPRDFIISLPTSNKYIGPELIFGISPNIDANSEFTLPIVCQIDDYERFVPTKHKLADPKPTFEQIPDSLKRALKCFILTCAIRRVRGQKNAHNSMLIHVSRYMAWQECIKELVDKLFQYYKQEIEASDSEFLNDLKSVYEIDTPQYLSYKTITTRILASKYKNIDSQMKLHDWEDICAELYAAVQKIEVRAINGTSGDVLDYEEHKDDGISVIVIGGDKLSRGLTIEGLSVSYFLRASTMYDTLMQMGRWFGYRPGYVDLCRLFTSSELNDWFRHITIASSELREEFTYLAESHGTPDQYALRVRTHPGKLQITSAKKMQNALDEEVSWAARLIETYQLPMDKELIHANLAATEDFLKALPEHYEKAKETHNLLWRNIKPELVCNFLSKFYVAESLKTVDMSLICEYIRTLVAEGELTSWNVVLMNKVDNPEVRYKFHGTNIEVGCYIRNRSQEGAENSYYIKKNHIAGSPNDEFLDLDEEIKNKADKLCDEMNASQDGNHHRKISSQTIMREKLRPHTTPLMILYPLDPQSANPRDCNGNVVNKIFSEKDEPFIGVLISFPNSTKHVYIKYKTNRTMTQFLETMDSFEEDNDNDYDRN